MKTGECQEETKVVEKKDERDENQIRTEDNKGSVNGGEKEIKNEKEVWNQLPTEQMKLVQLLISEISKIQINQTKTC